MKPLFILLFLLSSFSTWADDMIMIRVNQSYDDAMITIKQKIEEYEYKIAHIQKCDGGMESMGYQSDEYKVIFFGKYSEINALTEKFPSIIPYVPLKLAVIKEGDSIVLVIANPSALSQFFRDETLTIQFKRWENDIRSMFKEVVADASKTAIE